MPHEWKTEVQKNIPENLGSQETRCCYCNCPTVGVTDNSLTENRRNSAVVIAMQSQLKDYVPTGDAARRGSEAQEWTSGCRLLKKGSVMLLWPVPN